MDCVHLLFEGHSGVGGAEKYNRRGNMSDTTILATISNTSGTNDRNILVADYKKLLADKDKKAIAEMLYHRFYGRYIKPYDFPEPAYKKHYRHGFSLMAISCLLIEALESFYQGWEETETYGSVAFESFFKRGNTFKEFIGIKFYKHVRCGILHQGETTGGFTIVRQGQLIDHKRIGAHRFFKAMGEALEAYRKSLEKAEWDSDVWVNARKKMQFILKHC